MKVIRLFTLVVLMALTLVRASMVQAQKNNPECGPFSPEAVEEIIATRGSAIEKYCPGYMVLGVAVAKASPLTHAMVDEIAATRGLAADKYIAQNAFAIIPVTSGGHSFPPTQAELDEIIATRGTSLMGTQGN
jgi:hypothetical protein